MSNEAKHLDLLNQVINILVNMSKPVDLPAGQVRGGRHQVLVLRAKSKLVGEGRGIDVGTEARMFSYVINALPVIVHDMMKIFKALEVILFGYNSFHILLHKLSFSSTLLKCE